MPMDQTGPLPIFLSKILWGLSQVCPLLIVSCSYCANRAEQSSCNTRGVAIKANACTVCPSRGKFADFCVRPLEKINL